MCGVLTVGSVLMTGAVSTPHIAIAVIFLIIFFIVFPLSISRGAHCVKCNMVTTCARTWYTNSQS